MTNKVLIITHKEDYTADFLINKLNERKLSYKRLNCEDLSFKLYNIDNSFNFRFENEEDFSSVWFRRTRLPLLADHKPEIQFYLAHEYEVLLKNLFSILDCKWVSDPFKVYKAENKLLQLKEALKIGFSLPDTLITNSKEELINFYSKHNEKVIIKPLSQSKIFENESTSFIFSNVLKKEHVLELKNYDLTPCIYQQQIEKEIELRITVVGEKLFVAGVDSQKNKDTKIDWRKGDLSFFPTEIPNFIKEKCFRLVKNLGLRFGAIDMILDKSGNYIFLEINPNGQWAWIETQTDLPISNAIINELYNK